MTEVSDVLREARNGLFEYGWCQGTAQDVDGKICSMGAISLANLRINRDRRNFCHWDEYQSYYDDAIVNFCGANGITNVARWNDETGRTLTEVMDAFEKAEKYALIREEQTHGTR